MTASRSFFDTTARLVHHRATRPLGVQLLSVAVALLCSAAVLLGLNIVDLHRQVDRDRRADKLIEQLDQTANHLLGIEVEVRGYALFGNPNLLVRYKDERRKLTVALAALDTLTSDTPADKLAVAHIRDAVAVRMKIVAHAMSMKPDPPIKLALYLRNANQARGSIDAARGAIGAMRRAEDVYREQLAAATEQQAVHNFTLAAIIVLVSVVIGILGTSFALLSGRSLQPRPAG
ncbi:MAG: CHASE3 domain-containing protein [Alphaproteobacteria bacterium]|nr:CHASE3 domain-containing protein [Alphaproteobacteria bacterium]